MSNRATEEEAPMSLSTQQPTRSRSLRTFQELFCLHHFKYVGLQEEIESDSPEEVYYVAEASGQRKVRRNEKIYKLSKSQSSKYKIIDSDSHGNKFNLQRYKRFTASLSSPTLLELMCKMLQAGLSPWHDGGSPRQRITSTP